jgi:hypothetical protein
MMGRTPVTSEKSAISHENHQHGIAASVEGNRERSGRPSRLRQWNRETGSNDPRDHGEWGLLVLSATVLFFVYDP